VTAAGLAIAARVVSGETALHRRVRREFMVGLTVVSFVVIYRIISTGPG